MAAHILRKPSKASSILTCSPGCRHKLIIDTQHAQSSYGLGVLRLAQTGSIFDGVSLHVDPGARIKTTDPQAICNALGVPYTDPQVIALE